ncbi:uncharacterized protein LOC122685434 isoform X2 [Cervus elaphus]|uniref:uncharacterized protein LOC122685433 isoform X3 n=1 Tax=Cervus elaphus TaxID=9860 RepID=UPI001CC2FCE1|nr:uncharacterized protein LOC122685433 isoform X3 [Cervus elaphus]XP_043746150.1 uncharacterized protein LOC122685434 isoform X2 [Cervus elaphus]
MEESQHHPPAQEAQCRVQESVPTEGSAQLGMKRKPGRPAAQTAPRTHPRAQSQPAMGLSTPGSDPEPREPLPLRQQEDLEHSTAEHRGAGPREPLKGNRDLSLLSQRHRASWVLASTLGRLDLCACRTPSPRHPCPTPLSPNVHLQVHLPLLGLWQENLSLGMSYHLCRESLPWLLPKTRCP